MPEIDLKPREYRWRRPLSKPLAWGFVVLGICLLGFLYFTRSDTAVQFFCTCLVSLALGLVISGLFRDVD